MKNIIIKTLLLSLLITSVSWGFRGDMKSGKSKTAGITKISKTTASGSGKVGDAYDFRVNRFEVPINSKGILGDVSINNLTRGEYDGKGVLFSGGFMMSGLADTGTAGNRGPELWANAMASASRTTDYLPGPWSNPNSANAQLYILDSRDPAFGDAWQDWKDAVDLGADFYDGDGDGVYNPVDKNGNGMWDPNEDKPDIIGDLTAWCVYRDAVISSQRNWTEMSPRGLEIQQTLFGFRSAGALGSMLFLRYRIVSRGYDKYSGEMDSVYFAVWADADLGDYSDDAVGCDTVRSAGYVYNGKSADKEYGTNPPCFLIDFFQGPIAYIPGVTFTDNNGNGTYDQGIDTPIETAHNVRGLTKGVSVYPGGRNLGLSSFVNYVQSDPTRGDPEYARYGRNYMLGRLKKGEAIDPCNDQFGSVVNYPCTSVNPVYWYAGNPITRTGWLYGTPGDMRMMQNVGPFKLSKDKPADIVVALIVGRGSDNLNSITVAQEYSDVAQFIYDRNFETPPPPPMVEPVTIRTTESEIYLTWRTKDQVTYKTVAYSDSTRTKKVWDMGFEGYEITAYKNPVTASDLSGLANSKIIARYDLKDNYDNIYLEGQDGSRAKFFEKGIQMDSAIFASSDGILTLKISSDPFTGEPLIKGKPYYFSIRSYSVGYDALASPPEWIPGKKGLVGDYLLTGQKGIFLWNASSTPILKWGGNDSTNGICPGVNIWDPVQMNTSAKRNFGTIGETKVTFEEVFKDSLTGDSYTLSFFKNDASTQYSMFWRLKNNRTNVVLLDSQLVFNPEREGSDPTLLYTQVREGFRVRVDTVDPGLKTPTYSGTRWYKPFVEGATGAFYSGGDLSVISNPIASGPNKLITADKMRQVEIRFGLTQKAYRYIFGTPAGGYRYAAGRNYPTRPNNGKGFVDVPFQVWEKDSKFGTERQLNVGFFEGSATADGIWKPGTDILSISKEHLLIFNSTYSSDSLRKYTGGTFNGATQWCSPMLANSFPSGWGDSIMTKADSLVFRNSGSDILYVVGLNQETATNAATGILDTLFYKNGDVLTIPLTYPILTTDSYTFTTRKKSAGLTDDERKATWNKVNVFPNPLFAFNSNGSYLKRLPDDPYVTFSNLPKQVTVRIYSLSGSLLRTLTEIDKWYGLESPFLEWDLHNSEGLRVASGMYIAIVSSAGLGERILKFAIIMPQKQIQRF